MAYRIAAVFICLLVTVSCATSKSSGASSGATGWNATSTAAAAAPVPPMDPKRKITEQDCSKPVDLDGGNLRCKRN